MASLREESWTVARPASQAQVRELKLDNPVEYVAPTLRNLNLGPPPRAAESRRLERPSAFPSARPTRP